MNTNGQELTAEDIMRAALSPENFEQWKIWNERQKQEDFPGNPGAEKTTNEIKTT